ncbi:dynein light chain Tctex-type 5-like [Lytechinus pictus]|uniref:dynein light chain Tctex-type 5-like n=1 Tax=Lytechinus variegatus TaxID=7654 RepID=UPI001BB2667E|nr:dynein light chain Tctex-type 5-like [Lytechinus variegatus]XP_054764523.1 dynein light chain Tctex-type 5-like [Lytechinus pictus]
MAQTAGSKYSASTQRSAMDARGGASTAPGRPAVRFECTYKMEPDKKFMVGAAKQIVEDILTAQLESQSYDPQKCPVLCRELADVIKHRVKELLIPRYKIVAMVTIGSTEHADVCSASQCVWNDKFDSYAQYTYKNGSLYATGIVYGIYQE